MRSTHHRPRTSFNLAAVGLAAFGLLLLGGTACEAETEPAPPQVVARVESGAITYEELSSSLAGQLQQLDLQRQELLLQGLEQLVERRLLENEARRREVEVSELLEAEVGAKARPVTQQEIESWYEQNRARVGRPLETVAGQVKTFLEGQRIQELRQTLLAKLRQQQDVQILLEPPRIAVEPSSSGEPAAKGPEGAAVTLVEFSDFQCPWCSRINPTLEEIRTAYGDDVRIEFRHFPLDQLHPQARKASEAAFCAQQQGKFWQLHDDLFAHQSALGLEQIQERAAGLGLELADLQTCLDSGEAAEAVAADVAAGTKAGVSSTPSLFVNGRPVRLSGGTPPFQQLAKVIDDELARKGRS